MNESNRVRQNAPSTCRVLALTLLLGLSPWLAAGNDDEATSEPERLYFTIVSTITDQERGDVHEHRFSVGTTEGEPARISTNLNNQGVLDYIVSYELPDEADQVLLSIELVHNQDTIASPRLMFRIGSEASIQSFPDTGFSVELEISTSREQPHAL
jgi:hypothetical protein